MKKTIIAFFFLSFTLIWAAPAFAQDKTFIYARQAQQRDEKYAKKRKPMIDPNGNPINGYDDTRTKEDEARAAKETFKETWEYAKQIFDKIQSFFSDGGQQPNKARQAQQPQPKGRNSSKRAYKKKK